MRQTLLKSFLLLYSLIVGSVAWADTVTILPSDGTAVETKNFTIEKAPITVSVTASTLTSDQIRVFKGQTITISSTTATISKVEFTCTANGTAKYGPGCLTGEGYTASTGSTGEWTGSASSIKLSTPNNQARIKQIVVTYSTSGGGSNPTCETPTFSPAGGIYSAAMRVEISTKTDGATIYYTTDGNDPTTNSNEYTGLFPITETTTVKAIAVKSGYDNSSVATATYSIVAINHAGTAEDPYTVSDALTYINALGSATSATEVYVSGIISQVDSYNDNYSSITYWISDDGTTGSQLEVYSGKGLDGAGFASVNDLKVGDIVTVKGYVKMFNKTPEFDKNNVLVSFERPVVTSPILTVSKTSLTGFTYAEGCGPSAPQTFDLTGENLTGDVTLTVDNKYYEISVSETSDYANSITRPKSEFGSKTIYVRLRAGLGVAESYSSTITITSEDAEDKTVTLGGNVTEYVPDYATLPFVFNGGRSDIENTDGLTQKGLGTDYNTKTTKLKFDGTGDYLILKINETAATLAFDVKGNSFSGGTFTVQTSTDGINYRDLNTYTELGDTQTEAFALAPEVRFVKWVYTKKTNGNVGLGNIKVVDWTETATVGEAKYATYVPNQDVIFSSGVEAYIGALNGKYVKLTAVKAVAKGTPVILKNTGRYVLAPARADELDDISSNVLKASTEATVADGTQYILAMPEGEPIGFYKASGIIPPGKAYLVVPAEAGVKAFYFEADDATAINEVNGQCSMVNGQSIYNLAGQRINKLQKGINIVGGKKVLF